MHFVRPIRNNDDLSWAIGEIAQSFQNNPASGTSEADSFDVLATLIEAYENKYHPVEAPDPIEVLLQHMESRGYSRSDLGKVVGSLPRSSEILNRKRALNVRMIRDISGAWGVPADPLIAPYHIDA